MNEKLAPIIKFAVLILVFAVNAFAQERPFKVGEKLVYEASLNKVYNVPFPFSPSVAELTFSIENAPNGKDLLIKSEAVSKGSLLKLTGFSFLQGIETTVDGGEFRTLESVKHDVQKKRVRDSVSKFNYQNKLVTFIENDPNEPSKKPRELTAELPAAANDMIAGIYSVRLLPLEVGKSFEIIVSDTGGVYKIPVRVTARERQKSAAGKLWCFRVEPEVFGKDRFIEKDGKFVVWLTDDARRLPVRAQIKTDIGNVEIKLKKIS